MAAAARRARRLSGRFDRPVCTARLAAILDDACDGALTAAEPPAAGSGGRFAPAAVPAADYLSPARVGVGPAVPDSENDIPAVRAAKPAACRPADATVTV